MKLRFLCLTALMGLVLLGCASEPEVRRAQSRSHRPKRVKQTGWAAGHVTGGDQSMAMQMSIGVLDEQAVDRAMKPHVGALAACFSKAGDARKYLSGQVVMRFVVSATGAVSDVQLIKNALGNYSVESCLVLEAKQIHFPAPEGRQGTDFEYAMDFRSTGEKTVLPWSGEQVARRMSPISGDLANCGSLGSDDVDVIAYVEPGGSIGSIGFASQGSLDPTAAVCAVALMRKVRINDTPSGVVLRATFPMTLALERSTTVEPRAIKLSKRSRPGR